MLVQHLDRGQKQRHAAPHGQHLVPVRRAHFHLERGHALVVGEAQQLGEHAQVRLAAFQQLAVAVRIEYVVVVGGLEHADLFLDEEQVVLENRMHRASLRWESRRAPGVGHTAAAHGRQPPAVQGRGPPGGRRGRMIGGGSGRGNARGSQPCPCVVFIPAFQRRPRCRCPKPIDAWSTGRRCRDSPIPIPHPRLHRAFGWRWPDQPRQAATSMRRCVVFVPASRTGRSIVARMPFARMPARSQSTHRAQGAAVAIPQSRFPILSFTAIPQSRFPAPGV